MKIVAITKTFRGEEFALASLEAIYPYVSKVVYVHSNESWAGRTGNTVIHEISKHPDPERKIEHIKLNSRDQAAQYQAGYECAEAHYDYDYLMMVDTDEVWARADLEKAIQHLRSNQTAKAFTCNMWSYIKSPFFRVTPKDRLTPVVFIRKGCKIEGIRGCGLVPKFHMQDVWMHHFCSVRKSLDEVWAKHEDSCGVEKVPKVDKSFWIQQKWNKLPTSNNLLPLSNYAHHWESVRVIGIVDLPEVLRSSAFVKSFEKYNFTQKFGISKENEQIQERLNELKLPDGFGPGHPEWKIPSKRNRYLMAIGHLPIKQPEMPVKPIEVKPTIQKVSQSQLKRDLMLKKRFGSVCIFTSVSGNYQWYIPLFLNRIRKEYPEYEARVVLRGRMNLPPTLREGIENRERDKYPPDGYTTAALRYVEYQDVLENYDFVLITDVDMLIKREDPNLVNQHAAYMEINGLECYENYVSSIYNGSPRLPGIHFVTKAWWNRTLAAREKYARDLQLRGSHDWAWDEVMLGKVVSESGLRLYDAGQNLWANHGIHLGDWRRNLKKKQAVHAIPAPQKNYIQKMVADADFMELVGQCGRHLEGLTETFDFFKRL